MEGYSRRTTPQVQPPSGNEKVIEPPKEEGRSWPLIAMYVAAALVAAIILVFGARWVYHKVHKSSTPVQQPAANTQQLQSGSDTQSPAGKSGTSPAPSPTPTPTPPAGGQIGNTGPGSVAAIFVATSLAAGGLHYIISLRRSA